MVSNVHYIELFIKGQLVELEAQDSLNLRINNVLFNPARTTTKQAEYSFSFEIPSTPINDKILDYANNLSKANKFHSRYESQVYADGKLIFDGSLTVQKYDGSTKMYTCNLVNIKVFTLEDIFGEKKLTDLKWEVDFDGSPTINEINADMSTKYFFPLVCYGAFQKNPIRKDEVSADYTPKHDLDKYNKWWVDSFYPSLNMVETMKKAFESVGYNVGGSALTDPFIKNIFASTNLADDQVPIYNVGNPKFGSVSIRTDWNNDITDGLQQDLKYPYSYIRPAINASNRDAEPEYNFSTIDWWDMLDSKNNPNVTITLNRDTYMYDPDEHLIVIPCDGWYKISLQCVLYLNDSLSRFTAEQWTNTFYDGDEFKKREVSIVRDLREHTPIEIQLVRNLEDNIELIKGKKNIIYYSGDPNQETITTRGGTYVGDTVPNREEWNTDCPHQNPYGSRTPTKTDDLTRGLGTGYVRARHPYDPTADHSNLTPAGQRGRRNRSAEPTNASYSQGGGYGGSGSSSSSGLSAANTYGYMHRDGYVMPFDQSVSESFICGLSSLSNGTVSVMRNGSSWSKATAVNNQVFADVLGMDLVKKTTNGGSETVATDYCKNTYKNSTNYCNVSAGRIEGSVQCCVYLNKDDLLELVAVQRNFEGNFAIPYSTTGHCIVEITAMSTKRREALEADEYWGYMSQTQMPTKLNLFNFTNNETNISDWIKNIQTAFNLDIIQNGTNIDINTQQGVNKDIKYAIDIDDRFNSYNAESQFISYPREMSVKYKIDTDEWGFELTVPLEHLDDDGDEWKKWGDSGFTVIQLSDDSYETSTQNTQTNFSYTYYDNFNWKEVLQDGTENGVSRTITIPVIEKAEFMAEGYKYEEAMKHDGFSLTQRFWFRQPLSEQYIWTADHMHEKIWLTYPTNQWEGLNLSYKDTEKSLVTEYFNIQPMLSSNYVNIDVYITPDEYNNIKNGALIHFDSDLYYTSQISGYDPSGSNPTSLKLIKKV